MQSSKVLSDNFLKTTEVIEITSDIVPLGIKSFYGLKAVIKINGDREVETNFLSATKKELKRIKVGFKWTGEYWGIGS